MTYVEQLADDLGVSLAAGAPLSGYRWVSWRGVADPPEEKKAELREKLQGASYFVMERHYDIESDGEVYRVLYW